MTKRQYPDPFSDIPDATEDGAVIDPSGDVVSWDERCARLEGK